MSKASIVLVGISALAICAFMFRGATPVFTRAVIESGTVERRADSDAALLTDEPQFTDYPEQHAGDELPITPVTDHSSLAVAPLPPRDSPLALIHDELKSRADRGDTAANCRLSHELARCRRMQVAAKLAVDFANSAEHSGSNSVAQGRNINMASMLAESAANDEKVCGTSVPEDAPEAWRYLLRAAEQGHVPSMVRFAVQPPLREDNFVEDLEGWKAYADNAGRLLRTAAATGDPRAIFYLHWAHAGYPTPGGTAIVETDPGQALAYAIGVESYLDATSRSQLARSEVRLRGMLTSEEVQIAEREGDRIASTVKVPSAPMNLVSNFIPDSSDECEVPQRRSE